MRCGFFFLIVELLNNYVIVGLGKVVIGYKIFMFVLMIVVKLLLIVICSCFLLFIVIIFFFEFVILGVLLFF